jgi:hypothetical protein
MTSVFSQPKALRQAAREGRFRDPTSGHAPGFLQANLMIVPQQYAFDFLLFCQRNPKPCPLIEVMEPGAQEPKCAPGTMITSAVTGVENQVWGPIKYYYEINAWFPKNIVFVNVKAFNSLKPLAQKAVLKAASSAETRGWARSQAVMVDSTNELRAHGIKVGRASGDFDKEIKRLGEKFSREWVRSVGNEANNIFIPYYTQ